MKNAALTFNSFCAICSMLVLCIQVAWCAPAIPKDYDRATVTRLVSEIDKGNNAALLKPFFAGHNRYSMPLPDAVALLEQVAAKEKRGTQRWFLLQNLRAFGSLHIGKTEVQKAIEVYGGIFDEASKIQDLKNREYLRNIVYDFISYVPTPYFIERRGDRAPAISSLDEVLIKALATYFLLGSPTGVWQPDWAKAINYTSSDVWPYVTAVQEAMKNPAIPKNANFYQVSILVLTYSDTASREEARQLRDELKQAASKLER